MDVKWRTLALGLSIAGSAAADKPLDFPEALVEVGVGGLMLPGAELCFSEAAPCAEGDASFEVHAWHLYRPVSWMAVGGGLMIAFAPRTDLPHPTFLANREESRGYLTCQGSFRYYPYSDDGLDLWLGAYAGLVVVRDSASLATDKDAALIVGQQETLATVGGTLGAGLGMSGRLANKWTLGGSLVFSDWFLPETREQGPIGNEATLAGQVFAAAIGIDVIYHIDL